MKNSPKLEGAIYAWKLFHESPDMAQRMWDGIKNGAKVNPSPYMLAAAETMARLFSSTLSPASQGRPKDEEARAAYKKEYLRVALQCGFKKTDALTFWSEVEHSPDWVTIPFDDPERLINFDRDIKDFQKAADDAREEVYGPERNAAERTAGKGILRTSGERREKEKERAARMKDAPHAKRGRGTIKSASDGGHERAKQFYGPKISEALKAVEEHRKNNSYLSITRIRKMIAPKFSLHYKTLERHDKKAT